MDNKYTLLDKINSPKDLKKLPDGRMCELCDEIRGFLIENVCKTGGHLASNLGVVELSVAIHRVFDSPRDHIIFDVGHQSYVHKLLTGRRDDFPTLRTPGGLSGFPKREESEHDAFGAGHSSTSVSAALGFATADKLAGKKSHTVAVIGDGAFTGGMVHEALNNCSKNLNLTIILNENEMSISKNTGSFARNIAKLRSSRGYFKAKATTRGIVQNLPIIGDTLFEGIKHTKKAIKDAMYGSNYFEDMGIFYLGPVDGNDYAAVEAVLREARSLHECTVVHIKTTKGKGYLPAETKPAMYHGIQPACSSKARTSYSREFGQMLSMMASKNKKICAITAAMSDGTGLELFKFQHPGRFFDVGIAEPHAVTFAAGLAANGMRPFVAIYSTFLQRAYDNIIHDVALQSLPVTFCIDRAGLNQSDGATHHGIFDVAFLSQIPGMKIYTPSCYRALEFALSEAEKSASCCAIRYPSGDEDTSIVNEFYRDIGDDYRFESIVTSGMRRGLDAVIISHGRITAEAIKARDTLNERGISVGLILAEMIKPYEALAESIAGILPKKAIKVITLEEEIRAGGFGMMLLDELSRFPVMKNKERIILATDDNFCIPRKGQTCFEASGVSAADIIKLFE